MLIRLIKTEKIIIIKVSGGSLYSRLFRNLLSSQFMPLGMCERVRTRNTLHEVGARKSKICYNAVEGREKMKNEKREKSVNK